MSTIERFDVNEEWAHSGVIRAGNLVFLKDKARFHGKYPVRKSIQTEFAHVGGADGLLFQLDGIAFAGE